MIRINVNLYPKDGYLFKEKDGALIRSAKGWNDIIVRVKDYRRRNNLPAGDAETEVHAQACANNPTFCAETNYTPVPTSGRSLKGFVLRWLAELRKNKDKIKYVSADEAKERAAICATCPFNRAIPEGCSPCKQAIRESRKELLSKRVVNHSLNACDKLGTDLPTAVHLDEQRIEGDDLPAHCWRKRVKP